MPRVHVIHLLHCVLQTSLLTHDRNSKVETYLLGSGCSRVDDLAARVNDWLDEAVEIDGVSLVPAVWVILAVRSRISRTPPSRVF